MKDKNKGKKKQPLKGDALTKAIMEAFAKAAVDQDLKNRQN